MSKKRKQPEKNFLVGLDIGTSKVAAIVGEVKPDKTIHIVGRGPINDKTKRGVFGRLLDWFWPF